MKSNDLFGYDLRLVKLISGEMFIGRDYDAALDAGPLVLKDALFVHVQVVQDSQTKAMRVNHDVLPWVSTTIAIPPHAISVEVVEIPDSLERQYIAATSSIQIASTIPPMQQ